MQYQPGRAIVTLLQPMRMTRAAPRKVTEAGLTEALGPHTISVCPGHGIKDNYSGSLRSNIVCLPVF